MVIDRKIFISTPSFDRSERHRKHEWRYAPTVSEDESIYSATDERDISLRMLLMGAMKPSGRLHYFDGFKYNLVIGGEIERNNRWHVVPLVYKEIQKKIEDRTAGKNGGLAGLSTYFALMACDPERLAWASAALLRCTPPVSMVEDVLESTLGEAIENGMLDLRNLVKDQLTLGPSIFDAEAIVAHAAAFWQHLNRIEDDEHIRTNLAYAKSALIHISDGNYNQSLGHLSLMNTRLIDGNNGFPLSAAERSTLSLFGAIATVDYLYRAAMCATSEDQRLEKLGAARGVLAGAERYADNYGKAYVTKPGDPVLDHFGKLKELIAEGIEHTDGNGTCMPLGIVVPDFGPTSARLSEITVGTRINLAISAYTPIKP